MPLSLSGRLTTPFGDPLPNAVIRFDAVRTSGAVLSYTNAETATDNGGDYAISVEYGTYDIRVKTSQSFYTLATSVQINSDNTEQDLNALLVAHTGYEALTPQIVLDFQALRDESIAARDAAAASETAAAGSATAAATSESNAAASETAAAGSATAAATSESNAADSETAAAGSATAAATSESNAAASETAAADSATAAATSESNAAASETAAADSATAASTSEGNAAASETAAAGSASAAATSESNAADSETAAAGSATAAATSESNAAASETAASNSAAAAATSESNAAQSAQEASDAAASLNTENILYQPGSGLAGEAGTAALSAQEDFDPSGSAQAAQDHAVQRGNHTGTQLLNTISDAGTAAAKNIGTGADNVPTTSQADARYAQLASANDFSQMPTINGVPIVERDSNDDGEWIRWASNAQLCTTQRATSGMEDNVWTYPQPFSEVPRKSATATTGASFAATVQYSNTGHTTSQAVYGGWNGSSRAALTCELWTIGPWS